MKQRATVYAIAIFVSILVVAALLRVGSSMLPDGPASLSVSQPLESSSPIAQVVENARHPLVRLLVQLLLIVSTARIFARLATRVG